MSAGRETNTGLYRVRKPHQAGIEKRSELIPFLFFIATNIKACWLVIVFGKLNQPLFNTGRYLLSFMVRTELVTVHF